MAINADGSSSKPGDWSGSGSLGMGSYQEPGQRSSYDSSGRQLTNAQGQNVAGFGSGWNPGNSTFSDRKPKDPLAALFAGGKGGPMGQVGTVVPRITAPVALPPPTQTPAVKPPGAPQTGYGPQGNLTYDQYVSMMTQAAQNRMGNWVNQPYDPLSSIRSDPFQSMNWDPRGSAGANQTVGKNGSVTKYQDRVPQDPTSKGGYY